MKNSSPDCKIGGKSKKLERVLFKICAPINPAQDVRAEVQLGLEFVSWLSCSNHGLTSWGQRQAKASFLIERGFFYAQKKPPISERSFKLGLTDCYFNGSSEILVFELTASFFGANTVINSFLRIESPSTIQISASPVFVAVT